MRLVSDDALATMTIWQEARGELHEGRVAVAEVIRNRTAKKYNSDGTVASTVLRAWQFSGWNTEDHNRVLAALLDDTDPLVRACQQAWVEAMGGSSIAEGALLYYNPAAVHEEPLWVQRSTEVAIIGNHHFFVPKETP